ncbi:MAG TPA: MotA/TolQ/ExbB proton channel family protein [Candidatus Acidoferrum sp.]|nr:MotA/TolQ/ExbB proton channel family protein [Candidatus Acidoferrum sp.]
MTFDFWLWRYAGNPVIWGILTLALFCFVVEFHLLLAERTAEWRRQAGIWLKVLPVLTSALPLLGLVGTINGMLETFRVMAKDSAVDHQTLLGGGIADALITTQLGLVMSIPGILICGFLRHRYKQVEAA